MTTKPIPALEPHDTVQELAGRWRVHNTTIVKLFRDHTEPTQYRAVRFSR